MGNLRRTPTRGRINWRVYKSYNGQWMAITQTKTKITAEAVVAGLKKKDPKREYRLIPPLFGGV